jgi:adenylosuccinate synthase
MVDLIDREVFEEKLNAILPDKNNYLANFLNEETADGDAILDLYQGYAQRLKPYLTDVSVVLANAMRARQQLLFEGAQGTHLDIDHGTYPFVTSSNTVSGNACCGAGIGPRAIDAVIGIVKAYTTRVGAGPFTAELFDDIGDYIQEKGAEFGATTGRRRRCGWLDTVILNNSVRLNGLTGLAITKLDVLGGLNELKICTAYERQGKTIDTFPSSLKVTGNLPTRVRNTARMAGGYLRNSAIRRSARQRSQLLEASGRVVGRSGDDHIRRAGPRADDCSR